MILAIDIGNTRIRIGIFRGKKLIAKSSLAAQKYRRFKPFLEDSIKRGHCALSDIEYAVVCSVVPHLRTAIEKVIASKAGIPVYVLGKNLKVPMKNLYTKPEQVGQDRLLCAYMAMRLYGAPVISIDLGTAITLDAVSRNREYLGGIILPGPTLSLVSLHSYTALLPQLRLRRPKSLIGKDTKTCMLSGVSFGYGSLIDGLIEKLKKQIGAHAKTVATGGDSLYIKPYSKKIDYFEPDMVLKGMALLLDGRV